MSINDKHHDDCGCGEDHNDCGCGCGETHDDCGCGCGCENEDPEIITLTDDNGEQTDFVIVDGINHNDTLYLALVEASQADNEQCEFIILKNVPDGDDDALVSIDDEDEFNTVRDLFEAEMENAGLFEFEEAEGEIDE